MVNQNPEQIARDKIDKLLQASGWTVQNNKKIDFSAGLGQAVREYQTDVGPADYVLFVDKKAVGVIEAKREEAGYKNLAAQFDVYGGSWSGDNITVSVSNDIVAQGKAMAMKKRFKK